MTQLSWADSSWSLFDPALGYCFLVQLYLQLIYMLLIVFFALTPVLHYFRQLLHLLARDTKWLIGSYSCMLSEGCCSINILFVLVVAGFATSTPITSLLAATTTTS